MGDIGAGCIDKWLGRLKMNILLNQLRQVVNLPIETHPAIVCGAVFSYFFGSVILSEFVRPWKMVSILDA